VSLVELAADLWLLLAAVGLALPVAHAGLPVLGQGAAVAAGAYGTALLAPHLPLPLAAAAAVVLAGVAAPLLAAGASRLAGVPLALATWAAAWLGYEVLTAFPAGPGGAPEVLLGVPVRLRSPSLGVAVVLSPGVHVGLAGALAAAALLLTRRALDGPLGLELAALRAGPVLARSLGVDVAARRRGVFTTGVVLGALAGVGSVTLQGVVGPADVSPLLSLELLAAVLVGGRAWWGPVAGVAVLQVALRLADPAAATAVLILAALAARSLPAPRWRGLRRRPHPPRPVRVALPALPPSPAPGTVLLRARGLVASYGGVRVLEGVDLDVRAGEVHAVLGPNGSGKTTLLRILAGALPAGSGRVELEARDVTRLGEAARARAGVVRTFQRTALLSGVPARREPAVGAVGLSRRLAGVRALLWTPSAAADRAVRARSVDAALRLTGLPDLDADTQGQALPTRSQRLLQLGRAAATGAIVLLLDEPAAGAGGDDRELLARVVRDLAADGRGVLLVEHDLRLVAAAADRVTVLAEGRVLATGTLAQLRSDPAVQRAYLGALPGGQEPDPLRATLDR